MNARREWLKTTLAMAVGLPLGASLANQLMAAPVSQTERNFFELNPLLPPMKIRLGSNENPYGPSDKAKQAIQQTLAEANRYPFQVVNEFKQTLAEHEGVTADHILIGAGSGDLLCATGAAFSLEGGRILSGFPTFPMLMNYSEVFKATWDKVNVNDELAYDYDAIAKQMKDDTRLVFICNPNNPTGTLVDPAKVKAFTEEISKRVPVFSDEAYLEFLEPSQQVSMLDMVKKGSNVIVSRTFSKIHGLAGLRIGYIVAKPDIIRKIQRNHPGIPNNQLAIAAAKASLGDTAFMDMSRKKNTEARKVLTDYLDKKGYFYGKSYTNFVMFDAKSDAQGKLSQLAQQGIAIRVWDYKGMQWLRVSVGTVEEMKTFVRAFDEIA
ncbi:MAG TPA: histidinol-phosphate transaminase [Chryseosolibacter sp.]